MKKFNIIQTCILIAVLLNVTRQIEAQNVALLGAESNPTFTADVQTKLLGTGQFTTVDILDVMTTTPTLAQLQAFDGVLVWSNANYADPNTLGTNLADYHDAGGGVVTVLFEGLPDSGLHLEGRWETDTYHH